MSELKELNNVIEYWDKNIRKLLNFKKNNGIYETTFHMYKNSNFYIILDIIYITDTVCILKSRCGLLNLSVCLPLELTNFIKKFNKDFENKKFLYNEDLGEFLLRK